MLDTSITGLDSRLVKNVWLVFSPAIWVCHFAQSVAAAPFPRTMVLFRVKYVLLDNSQIHRDPRHAWSVQLEKFLEKSIRMTKVRVLVSIARKEALTALLDKSRVYRVQKGCMLKKMLRRRALRVLLGLMQSILVYSSVAPAKLVFSLPVLETSFV
jgi:hypothetical protein